MGTEQPSLQQGKLVAHGMEILDRYRKRQEKETNAYPKSSSAELWQELETLTSQNSTLTLKLQEEDSMSETTKEKIAIERRILDLVRLLGPPLVLLDDASPEKADNPSSVRWVDVPQLVNVLDQERKRWKNSVPSNNSSSSTSRWEEVAHAKMKQLEIVVKDIPLPQGWKEEFDSDGVSVYSHVLPNGNVESTFKDPRISSGIYSKTPSYHLPGYQEAQLNPSKRHPDATQDFESPLPAEWEMRVTTDGKVFFVDDQNRITTWKDPRKTQEHQIWYDVTFTEDGPLGVHLHSHSPDAGASVKKVIEDSYAALADCIEPGDNLVAINDTDVTTAPFTDIMMLLKEGTRPLKLTFKRSSESRNTSPSASRLRRQSESLHLVSDPHESNSAVALRGSLSSSEHSVVSESSASLNSESSPSLSLADQIITSIFSMFWDPEDTSEPIVTV